MSKFTKYIKRYWRSTESLAGGLNTSIKVFFRKKVTEQYPENRHTTLYIPERHRAQLEMIHNDQNQHHCVACGLCQMACPNDTIRVVSEVPGLLPLLAVLAVYWWLNKKNQNMVVIMLMIVAVSLVGAFFGIF